MITEILITELTKTGSRFLGEIKNAFTKNPDLQNLLLDDFFKFAVTDCQVMMHFVLKLTLGLGLVAQGCCLCSSQRHSSSHLQHITVFL